MDGYGDMFGGGGGYGGMGDMMPGLAGMMGGMGYGGYGYGAQEPAHTDLVDLADVEKFIHEDPKTPSVIGFFNEDTQSDVSGELVKRYVMVLRPRHSWCIRVSRFTGYVRTSSEFCVCRCKGRAADNGFRWCAARRQALSRCGCMW